LNKPETAIESLKKIVARDRSWSNWRAWHLLIECQLQIGDRAAALASAQELVKYSPTLHHRCLLAEQLIDQGQRDEAWDLLERGLADYSYCPGPLRRQDRPWAGVAKKLMKRY
jgi:hypothetical protein